MTPSNRSYTLVGENDKILFHNCVDLKQCHTKVSHNLEAKPFSPIPVTSSLKSNAILSSTNAKKSKVEKSNKTRCNSNQVRPCHATSQQISVLKFLRKLAKPQGLSMLALQYNVFIHDVDKLISLNSQLLMIKGGWGRGGVSCSSLLISLNSQLLMTKGGWGGVGLGGVSCS